MKNKYKQMKKYILLLMVLASMNIQAQEDITKKIDEAFNSLKTSAGGDAWTFKTMDELKSRTESPYIKLGGPYGDSDSNSGQSMYFKIFDLSNNGLTGVINSGFILNSQYQAFNGYLTKPYDKLYFSNNNISEVDSRLGLGYRGKISEELFLDNNKLTEYKFDLEAASWSGLRTGMDKFCINQNDITKLRASDIAKVTGGNQVYYAIIGNSASLMRVDNNRLDFESLIDITKTVRYITEYNAHPFYGNPDFVYDYYPQKPVGGDATTETVAEGTEKTLSFSLTHADNVYFWQLNGRDVPISTMKEYNFTVNEETAGVWRCKITNPNLPEVTLYSYDMAIFMQKSGNGAASDITIQQSTLSDNFPENAIVADFSATDPDSDELFYRLPDRTADNSHFRIINGKTLISSEILFNKKYIESYTIEVEVYDRFGGTFRKEFTITKNGTSGTQLPSDILLSNSTVEENSADKIVGTLSTKGVDGYSFSLAEDEGDNNLFAIDGDNLKTSGKLNFEKKSRCNIRVTATAADGTSIKKDFEIDITNVNDNPHDIILSSDRFNVNTPTGTIIAFVTAVDEDKTDKVFTFETDPSLADNKDFFFEDNIIKAKTKFTEPCSKQVTITVKDDEEAPFTKTFDIAVVKVNAGDNRPPRMIGLTSTVINTELGTGGKIADIALSDPDGDKGTFSCDNDYVEINGNSLLLKSKPESEKVFDVTIKATDGEHDIEQLFKIYVAKKDNGGTDDIIMVGESMVKIYPNPAQSYIHIEGLESARYQILNSNGMVVKQTTNSNIDIDNLRPGCYILRIETGGEVITRKIIKKN
jgi:hypothetical protein